MRISDEHQNWVPDEPLVTQPEEKREWWGFPPGHEDGAMAGTLYNYNVPGSVHVRSVDDTEAELQRLREGWLPFEINVTVSTKSVILGVMKPDFKPLMQTTFERSLIRFNGLEWRSSKNATFSEGNWTR